MPPTPRSRQTAVDREISNTNNTLNQFLGGKRKSWMPDAADASITTPAASPRQPPRASPRQAGTSTTEPTSNRASRTTPSIATAAGTLPSPVLSEEPSPETMNTNARVYGSNTATVHNINGGQGVSIAVAVQQARAAQGYAAPSGYQNSPQHQHQTHMAPSINNYVHSRPNQNGATNNKRRRITQANSPSLSQFYPLLENYIKQCKDDGDVFSQGDEKRFGLLRTACHSNDYSYIAFHQVLSLWFADRDSLKNTIAQPGQNDKVLDRGLCHMTNFLQLQNAAPVAAKHAKWFTSFPSEFNHLRDFSNAYRMALNDVSVSLILITQNIYQYLTQCVQRRYPPIADEIINIFRVPSPIMQRFIFTWIRHEMGIPHDNYAEAMLQEFQQSQDFNAQLSARINTNMPPTQRELEEATNYTRSQYLRLRSEQEAHLIAIGAYQPLAQNIQQPNAQTLAQPIPMAGQAQPQRPLSIAPHINAQAMASPGLLAPALQSPSILQQQQLQAQAHAQGLAQQRPSSVVSHHSGAGTAAPQINSPMNIDSSRVTAQQSPALVNGQFTVPASINQSRQNSFSGLSPHTVPSNAPAPTPQFHPQHQQFERNQAISQPTSFLPQYSHTWNPQQPRSNNNMTRPNPGGYPPRAANNGAPRRSSSKESLFPPAGAAPRPPHLPDPDTTALMLFDRRDATLKPVDRQEENKGKPAGRYYQTVKRFIVYPSILEANFVDTFEFALDGDDISHLPDAKRIRSRDPEVRDVKHGSLLYRIRCVQLPKGSEDIEPADFMVADTTWPAHITIETKGAEGNPTGVPDLKRKQHYGKDLPVDITTLITRFYTAEKKQKEKFSISVAVSRPGPAEKGIRYAFAVEEIEILRHDIVREQVLTSRIPFSQTEADIKALLAPTNPDDDDDIVMAPADLTINLACPFSARLWKTPVKAVGCLHRECFDLDTWLETRPETRREKTVLYYEQDNGGAFVGAVDAWRCPLCRGDARVDMLRVDEWMMSVREKLVKDGLDDEARNIVVSEDGSWRVKEEVVPDRSKFSVAQVLEQKKEEEKKQKVVEIIDLDDD